jgi:hypothetical protein
VLGYFSWLKKERVPPVRVRTASGCSIIERLARVYAEAKAAFNKKIAGLA